MSIYWVWRYFVNRFNLILSVILGYTSIPYLVRRWTRHKVTILYYHKPKADVFASHLEYMRRFYSFISLSELVACYESGDFSKLPSHPLLITLDDGHQNNYELLPVLRTYSVRPVIYLVTKILGTNKTTWFELMPSKKHPPIKRMSSFEREKHLYEVYDFYKDKEYPQRRFLDRNEVRKLGELCDFGSHTRYHENLSACDDRKSDEEILYSKAEMEDLFKKPCLSFSYPNGDYTERDVEFVRKAGYSVARTIDLGWNDARTNPYLLKAIGISDGASVRALRGQLTGIPQYLTRFLMWGMWNGKHKTVTVRNPNFIPIDSGK